jgi:hypothetical protein
MLRLITMFPISAESMHDDRTLARLPPDTLPSEKMMRGYLLVILGISGAVTASSGLCALPLDSSRSATSVWRSKGEIDVLLRV